MQQSSGTRKPAAGGGPETPAWRTARILLDIGAVAFRPDDPFTHSSGRISPSYIDCRRLIAFPRERREVIDLACDLIRREAPGVEVIAGGETAGIPYGAFIAQVLDLPLIYVRKTPKGFGRMAQIEGALTPGRKVLLVEDLATDGGSKARFVDALRAAGAVVEEAFVVFHYAIFPASAETMARLGVRLHALATWHDVLAVAQAEALFPEATLDAVARYLDDPAGWKPGG